jgi:hypothetical protein
MIKTLSLILPVLMPSWRFFETIEPSPRIQWAVVKEPPDWKEFRPRPHLVSPTQMFLRLFWNPAWSDTLFATSCAERVLQNPTAHSIEEIQRRILADIGGTQTNASGTLVQFRMILVHRHGKGLSQDTVFVSDPFAR